jgi:CheY-like chemotaxis protein
MAGDEREDSSSGRIEDDDTLFFAEDDEDAVAAGPVLAPWAVLVVDDDTEVHALTRMLLGEIRYKGRALTMHSAHSAAEARKILSDLPEVAVILLDVVMETDDAGLRLVRAIREDMSNRHVRIILRTGQPGQAPEREVIEAYDINDYKAKTELTAQKLHTTLISALRGYDDIMALVNSRRGLRQILESSASLFQQRSMEKFAAGVLIQLNALLGISGDGILCAQVERDGTGEPGAVTILAASGAYENMSGRPLEELENASVLQLIQTALELRETQVVPSATALYMPTRDGRETVIFLGADTPLLAADRDMVQVFCDNISVGFDNVCRLEALSAENARLRAALGES